MVVIRASAPNKLHLCGEHSVVYGGRALIAPVEIDGQRNAVTLTPSTGGAFRFSGDLGSAQMDKDGKFQGDAVYFPILQVARFVCGQLREDLPSADAVLDYSGSPKGTGSSASIPVALALALYTYFNHVPNRQELYDAGFVGDNAYHGGKSSGGDVAAVLSDRAQLFHREFEAGGIKPVFESVDLHMPSGTSLLLVSSSRGQPNASTAAQIELFAKAHGVVKKPAEMSDAERGAIIAPFDAVVAKIESLCRQDADAPALGRALDENHALLQAVTTDGIEEALRTAKSAGALGGKLIGAGGEGGALIALCRDDSIGKVQDALRGRGFASWPVQLAKKGPTVDDIRPE